MLPLVLASALAFQAPPRDAALSARIGQLFHTIVTHDDSDPQVTAAEAELRQLFTTRGILTVRDVGDDASYQFLFLLCSTGPVGARASIQAKAIASKQDVPADAIVYCTTRLRLDRLKAEAMRRPPSNSGLRDQIEKLFADDQAVRTGKDFDLAKMTQVDRVNEGPLKATFDRYGVPTYALVGPEAASHFAIMIQHQPPEFRAKVLPKLKANVDRGQADASVFAMMHDRAERDAGRNQRYGENLECSSDNPTLHEAPLDDPAHVNDRRAAVGLMRMELYARLVVEMSPQMCGRK
jgi:hypothetical protein